MNVQNNKRKTFYAFWGLTLSAWWMLTGSMCEVYSGPDIALKGYPMAMDIGADGCDTILTGEVGFTNMISDWNTGEKTEYARGVMDETNQVERLDAEWLHVTSVYQQKQLHVVVDSNKTGKRRTNYLTSRHDKYEIMVVIYQKAEAVDSVENGKVQKM